MKKFFIVLGVIAVVIILVIKLKPKAPLETFVVKKTNFQEKIVVSGVIKSKNIISISSEVSGKINRLYKDIGDSVKKGDTILTFDNTQIKYQIEEQEKKLSASYTVSKENYLKYEKLYKEKVVSKAEFNQKEAAYLSDKTLEISIKNLKEQLSKYTIKSPIDGVITKNSITNSESVMQYSPLVEISSSKEKILSIDIDEKFASNIFVGQEVKMSFPNNQEIFSTGTIYYISPYVNKENSTIEIRTNIADPKPEFLYNINLNAVLYGKTLENVIVIPEKYIVPREGKNYVYILNEDKKIEVREIEISVSYFSEVLIKKGIKEGDTLVFPTDKIKKDVKFTHYA